MNFTNLGHLVVKLTSGVALGVVMASVVPGCGDEDHPPAFTGGGDTNVIVTGGPCTEGSTRDCHLTLSEHNGVLTCLNGSRTCDDGAWSDCEGDLSTMAAPSWYQQGVLRAQALSTPADCVPDNPCDPTCQQYDENPATPLTPTLTPGMTFTSPYNWTQGSLYGFPGGLVRKGINEPCHTASDCQFDMYCQYPGKGTCTHSMCETGAALSNTCDTGNSTTSCVQRICDVDSTCCTAANCEHDLCVTGPALKSACGDTAANQVCSKAVCDAIPSCCDSAGYWTSACVNAVATYCGGAANIGECRNCTNTGGQYYDSTQDRCYARQTNTTLKWTEQNCGTLGTSWQLATIKSAAEYSAVKNNITTGKMWVGASSDNSNWTWVDSATTYAASSAMWSPGGPNWPATSNNYYLYVDTAQTAATFARQTSQNGDTVYDFLCEGPNVKAFTPLPGAVSNHTWGSTCIGYVKTLCGAVCGTGAAAATTTGYCQAYAPADYKDTSCAAPNLTAPPTCSGNKVTVCNRGTVAVTDTFWIYSFTGNSTYFGDRSAAEMCNPTSNNPTICTVNNDVAAGACVTVDCTGNLANNGEVWVKPPTGVTECNCLDNWTLYKDSVPACSSIGCGSSDGFYPDLVSSSCSALVPSTLYEDGTKVSLTWTWLKNGNNEGTTALTYLTSSAGCTATPLGWYYTTVGTSKYFTLCNSGTDNACGQVKDTSTYSSSKVYVKLDNSACNTPATYSKKSFLNNYGDADSACGADQGIQWSYLTYDATIPSDSSIEFRLVVAQTEAELPTSTDPANAQWASAVTITRTSTQASCPTGSTCAIDLFTQLGGLPDAQVPYLAVLITLVPSSNSQQAPTMNSWDITYSCPDNQ